MKEKHKHFGRILFSILLTIAFVIFAGVKLGYANILSPKQGINEYHFYNDTIENKDSAKEIQKQIITNQGKLSDPGHVFKDKSKVLEKWQDEDGNDIKFDTPIEIKGNDKKIINVYPVFKNQVVITYYVDDKVYMTDTITDASSYKLPVDPTIYDANKHFVKWSTSKDGSSDPYDENSLKKDIEAGKTDIKLYAITDSKYKATFITGDGASFQEQIFEGEGSKLEKMPEDPTREGYEFSHWSLTEDGDPVDLNTLELSEDIDVYAVWKPVVVDYKFKVMVQNINDDGYTFHEIISARGLNGEKTSLPFKGSENPDPKVAPTGPIVEDIAKLTDKDGRFSNGYNSKDENGQMDHTYTNPQTLDYLGFHLNEEKTKQAFEKIEADGSTVVPVYMDRNVHTIWVYKNANKIDYYQANWVNATDENGNIHVDLRYGQSSEDWFVKLNQDYIYYMDKSIGSFYTRAPAMADKDIYMYRVLAKGRKYQLRFVEWDPSKFNSQINSGSLDQLKATLGTMKEIGQRVSFQNTEWYMNWNGAKYRVYEPYKDNYQQVTYSWVDKTDHVDDIKGFQPKKGDMSRDGLQSINVNNPAFRDYMFAAGKNVGGYQNYTGTPYIDDDGSYVGFLFYERKTYHINYYSGSTRLDSKSYKYEADTSDFGLGYEKGVTTHPKNPKKVFMGWYKDSTFSVPYTAEEIKTMPAHDITVYAKWDSRQYEVTFHTNQDDYEKDIEKITEIPEDDTLYDGKYKDAKASKENFPQPIEPKDATEFLGWYEKNQYGRYVKANLRKRIKNNDTHLYAKWKYDYLKLTYDLNLPETDKVEGTAPTDSSSYITDAKALVKDVGDVKVNGGKKVFVGWSETEDGSSGLIKPSETVLMDKNKTLYAQWKEIKDSSLTKVTYDPNGGKGSQYTVNEIIVEDFHKVLDNGKDENLKYSREGYAFKGWSRDKAATKSEFQAGEEVNVNQLDQDKNNYIYAIWAPIINYTTDGNGQVKEGENFVDKTKEEVELNSNPMGTETKANEGYKFSHWTADKPIKLSDGTEIKAGEKITEDQLKQAVITEPLTFTAHFAQDEFKVKHEFKVAEDSPIKEMPADVKTAVDAQLPEDKTAEDGKTTTPGELKDPKDVEDKTNDGVWTFEGFEDQDKDTTEVDAKVNGADVTFEGAWKFTPNKHKVTYEYVSGTEGKELPEELKSKAPKDVTGKVKGEKVTSPVPTGDDAEYRDDANKGTWTFKSYDKNEVEITNKDENVKGTWVFTPDAEVVTEYVDEDGKTIAPKENGTKDKKDIEGYEFVETKTDEKGNTKHIYKKVKPTPEVVTEYVDEDGKTIADKENGTKDKKDIEGYEFVETKKDEKGNTKHIYKKVKPTPEAVTEYVDEDGKTIAPKENGTKDKKDIEGYEFVETKTDEKGNTKHIYKKVTPDPEKYNVTHKFVSATEGKDLPKAVTELTPDQQTGKKDGSTVTPTAPKETTVEDADNDGKWTFEGFEDQDPYTKDVDAKVNGKDVTFEGAWKFTPNEHKVTYEYVSGTEGKELPEELKSKAPKDVTGKVKGEKVTSPVPTGDDATFRDDKNKGTWTFKSYDKNEVEITNKDENVKGTWVFTPDAEVVTEYVDEDGKTIAPKENGTKDKKDIPGYEFVETKTDEQGNTKHIYKKVTPPTDVVTEYVDEDGKTIADKENGTKDKKDIPGYEFVETKTDDKGNTKHIYKKVTSPTDVVTEYVDEDGKTIADKENGTKDKKDIEGYEFVETKTDDKGNTKHIYKKVTSPTDVVTEYVDEDGKTISDKENGTKDKKDIPGYEFVETKTDDKGNTKHIYKKVTPPTDVVTEYVDEDGKTIADKENGTKDKKDIEGYEFVKTEKDEQGNTRHIYKKKTTPSPSIVTKFVDENGSPLANDEDGTKDKKDIPGYEFVKTTNDKDGNVVHVYRFKQTPSPTVETRYFDTEGNQILADKSGTHDPSTIEGYQFVRTEKDEQGNTVHIYQKLAPVPKVETRYVDENGNQLLPPKEGEQGLVAIDGYNYIRTSKDDNGNTIHTYSKTPFEDVETRYVDTEGNQILADKAGENPVSEIEGYEFLRTEKDEEGNITHIYQKLAPVPKVETRYIDENGNQLLPPIEGTQNQVNIEGYVYVSTNNDNNGNTIHIYKKVITPTEDVVTKFVDENGNEIAQTQKGKNPSQNIEGYEIITTKTDDKGNIIYVYRKKPDPTKVVTKFVDEKGNPIAESEDGKKTNKDIKGYEFVKTETDKDGNTVHIYKKKTTPTPEVVTEYVDEDGKTIAPKENGTKDKKDIKGYEFVETKTDEKGNTKHIYKKVKPTPKVVTEYVDEDGKTIAPKENGTKDKKDIEGYEFVETKKDEQGNTKHIYKKKDTSKVVTKFVDEKGNTIAESEDGKKPNKDIKGYEFVKTEKDKDGNTVHIYKKKETPTVGKITKYVDENGNKISESTKGENPKKDIDGYEFVKTEKDKDGNTVHIYKKKDSQRKNPAGKAALVSRPATVKKGGNVRTGVGSSLGALVTLAGSALALFKSKKRK